MRWKKGHTFKHRGMYATFSGRRVLFKTRAAQQSVALDNWEHPERKEQEWQ